MADLSEMLRARLSADATPVKPRGLIKAKPEDFQVMEVNKGRIAQPNFETSIREPSGDITLFTLTKRGMPGEAAYREIAKQLDVPRDAVSDQGLKDSQAVTAQQIAVEGRYRPTFKHPKMWLRQTGTAHSPLHRGGHDGNHFRIFVKTTASARQHVGPFRNLFGYQRFGSRNEIGELLLLGDFDAAGAIMSLEQNNDQLRSLHKSGHSWQKVLFHPSMRHTVRFSINAFLSHLWNQLAKETDEKWLAKWSCEQAGQYARLWQPESLDEEMYELVDTSVRPVWQTTTNQGAHRGEGGVWHNFTLRPGAYATTFLANLYNLQDATNPKAKNFAG